MGIVILIATGISIGVGTGIAIGILLVTLQATIMISHSDWS